jgi:hypothetical protein
MTGTVELHLDRSTPVGALRKEFEALLQRTDLWDGQGQVLQVVDTTPSGIVVRALMTARDAGTAFDLRCLVREELIAFLAERYPHALPRVAVQQAPQQQEPPRDG